MLSLGRLTMFVQSFYFEKNHLSLFYFLLPAYFRLYNCMCNCFYKVLKFLVFDPWGRTDNLAESKFRFYLVWKMALVKAASVSSHLIPKQLTSLLSGQNKVLLMQLASPTYLPQLKLTGQWTWTLLCILYGNKHKSHTLLWINNNVWPNPTKWDRINDYFQLCTWAWSRLFFSQLNQKVTNLRIKHEATKFWGCDCEKKEENLSSYLVSIAVPIATVHQKGQALFCLKINQWKSQNDCC